MQPESQTFYDQHPFDWIPSNASSDRESAIVGLLATWVESLPAHCFVVDVGCGPGRVLGYITRKGFRCAGVDRSRVSVETAAQRCSCPGAVADNLNLPFADHTLDAIVSDGVIHHTGDPEKALAENCRVLKPGGLLYLAVYKPFGKYPWLYKHPGAVVRAGLKRSWARPFVVLFFQLPYFLVHAIRSRGRRTWRGAQNLFYDYFASPYVAFLSRSSVEQWCAQNGARVLRYSSNPGWNVHSFSIQKHPAPGAAV